ncbi:107-domain-containing protein [Lineolata rhizophorae]|uniref:Nuclear pore complex protein n=1 Tax=Lineolata rhizophorae TaxID=578093 RepID=A0A6A6P4V1_9PEZI|nr:107-domain-containing protein [Lineolata rhizophorae]
MLPHRRSRSTRGNPLADFDSALVMAPSAEPSRDQSTPGPASLTYRPPRSLHPLQDVADRVGREVEQFAEEIDKWYAGTAHPEKSYRSSIKLAERFQKIAEDTVERLKKKHAAEDDRLQHQSWEWRIRALDSERGSPAPSTSFGGDAASSSIAASRVGRDTTVKDLRQWQQEVNTWRLLKICLEINHGDAAEKEKRDKEELAAMGPATRFTGDDDIWRRFLLEDRASRGRKLILEWLESTAESSSTGIDEVVEQLKSHAGQGRGTWSKGWLHTREKIKGQKRLRPWGPETRAFSSHSSDPLVTQLDPDAMSRQGRMLEKPDTFYERSLWLTCWELLRRGVPRDKVRDWAFEHNEAWRIASLGFSGTKSERWAFGAANSGALWRRMCAAASRNAKDEYERAVYGLLSGELQSADIACRSYDDLLYVRYNSLLLGRFDNYLQTRYPERLPAALAHKFPVFDAVKAYGGWMTASQRIVDELWNHHTSSAEAKSPMKLIQASLLSNRFPQLVNQLGMAISRKAGPHSVVIMHRPYDSEPELMTLAGDYNALRIVAHIYLILKQIGVRFVEPPNARATEGNAILPIKDMPLNENVLVGYLDFLRLAGKLEIIPLYASHLTGKFAEQTLGRILPDVRNPAEQQMLVKLMEQYNIDVSSVFLEQYCFTLMRNSDKPLNARALDDSLVPIEELSILEDSDSHMWPGQRIVNSFMPKTLTDQDEAIVRSVEWYMLVRGEWVLTFGALNHVMKHVLLSGQIGIARAICEKLPYAKVSMAKSETVFGRPYNLFEDDNPFEEKDEEELEEQPQPDLRRSARASARVSSVSQAVKGMDAKTEEEERKRRGMWLKWEAFKGCSQAYYDMENLVTILSLLSKWRRLEDTLLNSASFPPANVKTAMKEASTILDRLEVHIDRLMDSTSLATPHVHDTQPKLLQKIRSKYLPECIIAYNTALHCAAELLSPDYMVTAMDLPTRIADNNNTHLQDVFLATNRMEELVDAFANDAERMLMLNEHEAEAEQATGRRLSQRTRRGGRKIHRAKREREWMGETMKIWNIHNGNGEEAS